MRNILVATDDAAAAGAVEKSFSETFAVRRAQRRDALLPMLEKENIDVLFIDLDWLDRKKEDRSSTTMKPALSELWAKAPNLEIIVLTPQDNIREAVSAVKAGAGNYLTYPVNPAEATYVLESLQESHKIQHELDYLRKAACDVGQAPILGTESPHMKKVFEKVAMVAPTKSTVLITGETGTGKGVIARLIHSSSASRKGPFVAVHCGAIPESLIESELFGHEKGSFTGAVKRKAGRFEIAAGGTIFLDEIGTISQAAQVRLLQVLQDKVFQRVGGETDIPMHARIIAAANVDLEQLIKQGAFRQDLFFRLNVFPIEVPPLRDRREDIPLLAEGFLEQLRRQTPKGIGGIHPTVIDALCNYSWPGNVRELENLIERAFILETSHMLTPESFPADLFAQDAPVASVPLDLSLPLAEVRNQAKEHAERRYLKELLGECKGRIGRTAQRAGITPRQLHKLLTRYNINKVEFR
ncbi:MAG: sigma-54 dependent transcriptional regulator [Desulfocurvibacter africanus]